MFSQFLPYIRSSLGRSPFKLDLIFREYLFSLTFLAIPVRLSMSSRACLGGYTHTHTHTHTHIHTHKHTLTGPLRGGQGDKLFLYSKGPRTIVSPGPRPTSRWPCTHKEHSQKLANFFLSFML
jgi:hypothetical protein